MSAEENKAIVQRYFEAISGKEKPAEILDEYLTDEELKHHVAVAEAGFPRYELIAEDTIAEGDKVAVHARLVATHQGDFMGIPATNKRVDVPVMLLYRLDNGKIAEHQMVLDSLSLMQQLGVIPTPEQTTA